MSKKRIVLIIVGLFLTSFSSTLFAQSPFADVFGYHKKIPPAAKDISSAYETFYGTSAATPFAKLKDEILKTQEELYYKSSRKSRLLAMYAGLYDKDGQTIDFSKIVITRDAALERKRRELQSAFFDALENYGRKVGELLANKQHKPVLEHNEELLRQCQPEIALFSSKVFQLVEQFQNYFTARKFTEVLKQERTAPPNYIQLLECKAFMLDLVFQLVRQAESIDRTAADAVKLCKKYPDACK